MRRLKDDGVARVQVRHRWGPKSAWSRLLAVVGGEEGDAVGVELGEGVDLISFRRLAPGRSVGLGRVAEEVELGGLSGKEGEGVGVPSAGEGEGQRRRRLWRGCVPAIFGAWGGEGEDGG